jgi:hypothetical protein
LSFFVAKKVSKCRLLTRKNICEFYIPKGTSFRSFFSFSRSLTFSNVVAAQLQILELFLKQSFYIFLSLILLIHFFFLCEYHLFFKLFLFLLNLICLKKSVKRGLSISVNFFYEE